VNRAVLIVEDEWLVRMELAQAFEDAGLTVLESASAEDAIATMDREARIDLLVTDIRLTGPMTGWDLATRARALRPEIAVIYVSANPPVAGRDVSGSVFIDKPALVTHVLGEAMRLLPCDLR
jgi:CheY-like chemotaxis protein